VPNTTSNGLDVHYEVLGDGPPLLFLNGSASPARPSLRPDVSTASHRRRTPRPSPPRSPALGCASTREATASSSKMPLPCRRSSPSSRRT